jgi:hypothetical protein
MGTTLTGTTPQDTYDSLIKVTDNGPLSGTLKALSDGLGNDSTLSLSTTAASIAGTLAVTGNVTIDTSTLVVDAANNRVGVGIAAPTTLLDIQAAGSAVGSIRLSSAVNTNGAAYFVENAGGGSYFGRNSSTGGAFTGAAYSTVVYGGGAYPLSLYTNDAERVRITSDGNVGIGTTTPTAGYRLSVVGAFAAGVGGAYVEVGEFDRSLMILNHTNASVNANLFEVQKSGTGVLTVNSAGILQVSSGIQFPATQVASANANTLDDYEEGTFTATLVPSTSGTITLDSSNQTGVYTKIGRQVTVRGYLVVQSVSVPVGGEIYLRGLPFTTNGGGGASVSFFDAPSYAGSTLVSVVVSGVTQINIVQSAALVSNGEEYYFTATYFV